MKCANCGKKLVDDEFCMYCGYMPNGCFIGRDEKRKVTDLEQFLGADYDVIVHNQEQLKSFILGPLYFALKDMLLLSILFTLFDLVPIVLIFRTVMLFVPTNVPDIHFIIFCAVTVIFLFYNRFVWLGINNRLYLAFIKQKMKRIKKKMAIEEYAIKRKKKYNHWKKVVFAFIISLVELFLLLQIIH